MKRPRGPIAKKVAVFDGRVRGLWATLAYNPYKIGVVATDWRRWVLDHWEYWCQETGGWMPKPITPAEGGGGLPALPRTDASVLETFAELRSYMVDVEWPQGGPVGEVQLSLRSRGHRIIAQLKLAAHGGLRVTAEGTGVDDALFALEAALNAATVPWERDPYPLGGADKKKK